MLLRRISGTFREKVRVARKKCQNDNTRFSDQEKSRSPSWSWSNSRCSCLLWRGQGVR